MCIVLGMLLIALSPWKKLGHSFSMSPPEAFNGQSKGWNGGVPFTLIVRIFFSFDDGVIFHKLQSLVDFNEIGLIVIRCFSTQKGQSTFHFYNRTKSCINIERNLSMTSWHYLVQFCPCFMRLIKAKITPTYNELSKIQQSELFILKPHLSIPLMHACIFMHCSAFFLERFHLGIPYMHASFCYTTVRS